MQRRLVYTLLIIITIAYGGVILTLATNTRPALGLDLQGGISVTQLPVGEYTREALERTRDIIEENVNALGVAEPEILLQGNAIVANLANVKDQAKALKLVQVTGALSLRPALQQCTTGPEADTTSTTTTGSVTTTTAAGGPSRRPQTAPSSTAPSATVPPSSVADSTAAPSTSAAPTSTVAPSTTIAIQPISTPDLTSARPTTTTVFDPSAPISLPDVPATESGYFAARGGSYCQLGPEAGTGEVFEDDATARVGQGGWEVTVTLKDGVGKDTWNALAAQCNSGSALCPTRQLAMVLDGKVISAPVVQQNFFPGEVSITGQFSEKEARDLAEILRRGALPVKLEVQSVQNISPTLGKDSLRAAWISGLVGVGLVLLFMALYYRSLGLIAAAGLTVTAGLLWTVISVLSRTQGLALSLSGIAGIIVSVGVTIDSYVVFFERLKDEVRSGRTIKNSTPRAFAGAWRTIVVADLVSFIGAITLYFLTVGNVRNFAFFLGLSTLCDLVVSYFFTRPAAILISRTDWMAKRKVMGIEPATGGGLR